MADCGEVLVRLLENYGIDTVFGIPGNHTVALYRGLPESALRHITPRHEQGAAFMADGYARACGRPAACFLISGPGLTNAVTPMMQALADSVPMLVISAVGATHQLGMGEGHLHELPNQQALASQCTRFSHTLMRPDELPRVLAKAFAVFTSERPGPVHIEIPLDVIGANADHVATQPWPLPSPPGPDPDALVQAVELLRDAHNPLMLIGGGTVVCPGRVKCVAEKFDLPVINTVNAKGVMPASHPLAVGGSPSLPCIRRALHDADVILAVGTEFGETDYDMLFVGELDFAGKIIRIDIDARQMARNVRPELGIVGHANACLRGLCQVIEGDCSTDGAGRAESIRQLIPGEQHYHPEFAALFSTIREALPGLVLVGDSTLPTYYAVWQYETEEPRSYFHSATGGGTLGYAIPAAIGASRARPDVPVVALIGDGSAQFTVAELAAAVEAELPVIILLWNNQGYREIRQGMLASGITPLGVDVYTPDFQQLARGMGCRSGRVQTLDELRQALIEASGEKIPTLVELQQDDFISQPAGQWY